MSEPLRKLPPPPPPGALELAMALSFATRIEPELIRAVRLRILPHLDAGAEADLWFCAWVGARTPEAIALLPECLPYLRAGLVRNLRDNPRLGRVTEVVSAFHRDLSPALFLEEQITWFGINGDTDAASRHLGRALHALVRENRTGLAGWFAESWQRLPAETRSTAAAWSLANAARAHAPSLDPGTVPDLALDAVASIVPAVAQTRLGVLREADGGLLLGDVEGPGAMAILVPDTHPRIVEVVTDAGSHAVQVAGGTVARIEAGGGAVELRTGAGHVYAIERRVRDPAAGTPQRAPEREVLPERGEIRAQAALGMVQELRNLIRRFCAQDDYEALTRAVRLSENALRDGYPPRRFPELGVLAAEAQYLSGLHLGRPQALNRAVRISNEVRTLADADGGAILRADTTYGAAHRELFAYSEDISELNEALKALERHARRHLTHTARRARPPVTDGDTDRLAAELLRTHLALHEAGAHGNHLRRALDVAEWADRGAEVATAVALPLARIHLARYETTWTAADLERAEMLAYFSREPERCESERAEARAVLAAVSLARFRTDGDRVGLDTAAEWLQTALHMVPSKARLQSARLQVDLAEVLRLRFRLLSERADLDRARKLVLKAVDLLPKASVWRRAALSCLNRCLVAAHHEYGEQADLDRAVVAAREATRGLSAGPGSAQWHTARARLADSLQRQYKATGTQAFLDEAISVLDRAPKDFRLVSPSVRADHAIALGSVLLERAALWSSEVDAGRALDVLGSGWRDALEAGLRADEVLLVRAAAIAVRAEAGYRVPGSELRTTADQVEEVARSPEASPVLRLRAALLWGRLALRLGALGDFIRSHEEATQGIPALVLLSGDAHGDVVQEWAERCGEAAACALETGEPERALAFLEQRGSLLSARTALSRAEVDRPAGMAPSLAAELRWLWALLNLETGAAEPPALLHRRRVAAQADRLVAAIRATPGFEHLFTSMPAGEMIAAAVEGPLVVLNAAARRCDALIVTRQGISSVPLPDLADVTEQAERYRGLALDRSRAPRAAEASSLLERLWFTVVRPVLTAAGLTTAYRPARPLRAPDHRRPPESAEDTEPLHRSAQPPEAVLSRIWWCPTGPFALLPLHAAGPGNAAMDYAVHSYTPGIRALVEARSWDVRQRYTSVGTTGPLLVVIEPGTSYGSGELDQIRRTVPGVTLLSGGDATAARVRAELAVHPLVHYIGPGDLADGAPRPDAGDGAFGRSPLPEGLVEDGALAYLSADNTAGPGAAIAGGGPSLAACFHAAGYRHVIAVLGRIEDDTATRIAGHVYEALSDSGGGLHPDLAARALHYALRRADEAGSGRALLARAAMVHMGP